MTPSERLRKLTFDGRYLRLGGRAVADMRYTNNQEVAEAILAIVAERGKMVALLRAASLGDGRDPTVGAIRRFLVRMGEDQ